MAYLHCHNCGWGQDDFWDKKGYNPFRPDDVEWLKDNLFKDEVNVGADYISDMRGLGFDCEVKEDPEGGCIIKATDFVSMELMRKARSIQNMAVKTWSEWNKVKDTFECHKCGSKDELDID